MSTMSEVTIEALRSVAYLRPVDVQLANRMGALANEPDVRVCLALCRTLGPPRDRQGGARVRGGVGGY